MADIADIANIAVAQASIYEIHQCSFSTRLVVFHMPSKDLGRFFVAIHEVDLSCSSIVSLDAC